MDKLLDYRWGILVLDDEIDEAEVEQVSLVGVQQVVNLTNIQTVVGVVVVLACLGVLDAVLPVRGVELSCELVYVDIAHQSLRRKECFTPLCSNKFVVITKGALAHAFVFTLQFVFDGAVEGCRQMGHLGPGTDELVNLVRGKVKAGFDQVELLSEVKAR